MADDAAAKTAEKIKLWQTTAAPAPAARAETRTGTVADIGTLFDLAGAAVHAVVARLVAVSDDGAAAAPAIELARDGDKATALTLGRSKELPVGLRLPSARVSTNHAVVVVMPATGSGANAVVLFDTSTNGTWVNGHRLAKAPASEPDLVAVASAAITGGGGGGGETAARVLRHGDVVTFLNPTVPPKAGEAPCRYTFQQESTAPADARDAPAVAAAAAIDAADPDGTTAALVRVASAKGATAAAAVVAKTEEHLTCGICRCVYYKAVAALPCLHTFCAHCLSQWVIKKAKEGGQFFKPTPGAPGGTLGWNVKVECPECRARLSEIRVAHKLNELCEDLVAARPDVRPYTKDDLAAMDLQSLVPPGGLKLQDADKKAGLKHERAWSSDGDSDSSGADLSVDYSGSGSGSSDEDDDDDDAGAGHGWHAPAVMPPGVAAHPMPGFWHPVAPTACAQCATPSAVDGFKCPPHGPHLSCHLCRTAFPDRPMLGRALPQRCELCAKAFCDLYLGGCKNPAGQGYLQALQDHALDLLPTGHLFGGNTVEISVLTSYMAASGITARQAWNTCLEKFKGGEWVPNLTFAKGPLTPDTALCVPCCGRVFAALLYHFRRSVPRDALPPVTAARPDCWFGLECRTQKHNVLHAQKFNHVCPQVKHKE